MIQIRITDKGVNISGHAGTQVPPTKQEIEACAAVTALTHTLKYSIETLTSDTPNMILSKGLFLVNHNGLSTESELLLDAFLTGCKVLSEAYPEQIDFQLVGEKQN